MSGEVEEQKLLIILGGGGHASEMLRLVDLLGPDYEYHHLLVSVENTACHDAHQKELLIALAEEGYLIWCQDLNELPQVLEHARHHEFETYFAPECNIHTLIKEFLQSRE